MIFKRPVKRVALRLDLFLGAFLLNKMAKPFGDVFKQWLLGIQERFSSA